MTNKIDDVMKTADGYIAKPLSDEELTEFNKDLTELLEKHSVGFFPVIIPTADLSTVKAVIHQYKLTKDDVVDTKSEELN